MSNEFTWTDELVGEYIKWGGFVPFGKGTAMEQFKQSNMPKKEKSALYYHTPPYPEQPKKEWEIVTFIEKSKDRILYKQTDGRFLGSGAVYGAAEKDLVNSIFYPIHSVRRLSDNEVFTVGDLVKWAHHDPFKIIGFKIGLNDEKFCVDEQDLSYYVTQIKKITPEQPKKERIEVLDSSFSRDYSGQAKYSFTLSAMVSSDKSKQIQDAIQRVLNDDEKFPIAVDIGYGAKSIVSEEDYNRDIQNAEQRGFGAAREYVDCHLNKYKTFQDYLNSKK